MAAAGTGVRVPVLMAPIVERPSRTVQQQHGRIGHPHVGRYAENGALDMGAAARADARQGGVVAKLFVRMFRGLVSGAGLNPLPDANATGICGPAVRAWPADVRVLCRAGPGHAPGAVATAERDFLLPVADAPLDAMKAWLLPPFRA